MKLKRPSGYRAVEEIRKETKIRYKLGNNMVSEQGPCKEVFYTKSEAEKRRLGKCCRGERSHKPKSTKLFTS